VPAPEPRQRRVVRVLIGRQHPEGDVLDQPQLDPLTRPFPGAVRIQKDRELTDGS
jgi:hypothetical protein